MASWAQKRRFLYGGTLVVFVLVILAIIFVKIFYKVPSCSDGIQNGSEKGIDCGGSCQKLCSNDFLAPINKWAHYERVAPGLYNIAAYIANPNINVGAFDVPYHIQIYDNKDTLLITEYDGLVTIPPGRDTLAFKASVNVGQRTPAKVLFQLTNNPVWQKTKDQLLKLKILDKQYSEDERGSYLQVYLKNEGYETLGKLSVYAVLYDQNQNTLGFSKTTIDQIMGGETATAPFTWSTNHSGKVVSIDVLPVAEY